jgi:uncharacterized protein (UPF0276 family)
VTNSSFVARPLSEEKGLKLALNYSAPAAELVRHGQIAIDLYKCPDRPDVVAAARAEHPVYVHFDLWAGSGRLDATDWKRVEGLLDQTGTRFVNLHLAPRETDFEPGHPLDVEVVIERVFHDVISAVKRFGPERVIVENAPHLYPGGVIPRPAVDPDVISRLVREIGCGFLLDLSHARIAARQLGLDEREYVARMPVDHLRELHITGLDHDGQYWRDHMPLTDEDWTEAAWALAHIRAGRWTEPAIVALEYGGVSPAFAWRSDPAVMAAQAPRLLALVNGNGRVR